VSLHVRRALAAAAATATLVALAGCGGDGDSAADESSTTSAASDSPTPTGSSAPSDAATAESETAGQDADGAGEEVSADEFAQLISAALDNATTAHATLDLGALGSGEGDADYTTTPPELAMKMTMDALGGDVEVRLVDGTMYLKSPTLGDMWISTSLDDPNSPLGGLGSSLDVKKQMELFADAVTAATFEGAEDVDGESLDHYTATVDTEKLLQSLPSAAAGQAALPDAMTQEWWFDDEGLIRKFSSDVAGTTTTMTLSEWGEDVEIEAPPSAEVTTMPGTTTS
jgi:hypothetical protein